MDNSTNFKRTCVFFILQCSLFWTSSSPPYRAEKGTHTLLVLIYVYEKGRLSVSCYLNVCVVLLEGAEEELQHTPGLQPSLSRRLSSFRGTSACRTREDDGFPCLG